MKLFVARCATTTNPNPTLHWVGVRQCANFQLHPVTLREKFCNMSSNILNWNHCELCNLWTYEKIIIIISISIIIIIWYAQGRTKYNV